MIRLKQRVFITLVTLCMVASNEFHDESKYKLKNNKKLRETFDKLLYGVTSLNEERLDALNKFNALQNYLPKVGARNGEEIVAVIIPSTATLNYNTDDNDVSKSANVARDAPSLETSEDESDSTTDSKEETEETGLKDTDLLRQWNGCSKKAAKYCTKACKRAFKETCEDYKCKKSMRKANKKACKRRCDSEFRGD